jgi:hypothetical protein
LINNPFEIISLAKDEIEQEVGEVAINKIAILEMGGVNSPFLNP